MFKAALVVFLVVAYSCPSFAASAVSQLNSGRKPKINGTFKKPTINGTFKKPTVNGTFKAPRVNTSK